MTFETLATLSTGDLVKDDQSGEIRTVTVAASLPQLVTIEDIGANYPNWSHVKSRTTITKAELERIAEWHAKMKEVAEGKKK